MCIQFCGYLEIGDINWNGGAELLFRAIGKIFKGRQWALSEIDQKARMCKKQ